MKVLLIQPAKAVVTIGGEDINVFEPLALEYLAAGIKDEHDVRIMDMRFEKDLSAVFSEFRPSVVGITSYTVNVNTVKGLFREIKAISPEIHTIVGGHHATIAPEDFIEPYIDLIVTGEGVFVLKEVLRRIESGRTPEGLKGTIYRNGGRTINAPADDFLDLDSLPLPDRGLTRQFRSRYYTEWMRPLASIRTSKGCPFRCSFCTLWKLTRGRYLRRSPAQIVKELSGIREEYVFFDDDESLIDTERMTELARLIGDSGIRKRFFLYGRSDTVARHPKLIEDWKKIGLERVFMGLEFSNDEDLQFIRKGTTVKNNEDAVKLLQDLDIQIYASLMVRPEFSREDFDHLKRYCRALDLNFATFSVLTPLPGTDFNEKVKDRLVTRNHDYYDFIHTLLPTHLPLEEFYEELYRLYRESIPFSKWLSFLGKYPLQEIPAVIMKSERIFSRIRNAHRDYNSGCLQNRG